METLSHAGKKLLTKIGIMPGSTKTGSEDKVERQLEKARRAWLNEMKDLKDDLGVVILPEKAPELTARHLSRCEVVQNREYILQRIPKGGVGVEVGVQEGMFSRLILDICQTRELHLIDLDLRRYGIAEKFQTEIERGLVKLHEGDSSRLIAGFPDNYFDFIYIDADHSYPGVKKDIKAARTKVKAGGLLIFNDYTFWSPGECINYGVIQAVNELCVEDDWEFRYFALAGYMYCDVALSKIV